MKRGGFGISSHRHFSSAQQTFQFRHTLFMLLLQGSKPPGLGTLPVEAALA